MGQRLMLLAQDFQDEFEDFEDFQDIDGGTAVAGVIFAIVYVVFLVLVIAAMWRIFNKAGEPGWAAIIPIYNVIVLLRVAGKPWWWFLLFIIPIVNLIISIIVAIDLARNFGKGGAFAAGLIFLPFIFYPILAFGDARYQPHLTA